LEKLGATSFQFADRRLSLLALLVFPFGTAMEHTSSIKHLYYYSSFDNTASRGSFGLSAQPQSAKFRSVPQTGHSPLQFSLHK